MTFQKNIVTVFRSHSGTGAFIDLTRPIFFFIGLLESLNFLKKVFPHITLAADFVDGFGKTDNKYYRRGKCQAGK
jgi:hypothetical protein